MKIKKIIIAVLLSSMMLTFSACGKSIPECMSEEVYDYGVRALNVMDKYNDMEISADEASDRLDGLRSKLDALANDESTSVSASALSITSDITTFEFALDFGSSSTSDTYKAADDLRKKLGIEK